MFPVPPAHTSRVAQLLAHGQPVKIVCFGDSITGVYYHTGGRRAWSDALGSALRSHYPNNPIALINAGISGNTTTDGLQRMEHDVLAHRPDLIVAMFGMNDVVRVEATVFRTNLETLIARARAHQAEVVLMTPNAVFPDDPARPPEKLAAYAQHMREVALANQVALADCHQAFEYIRVNDGTAWPRLMSDPVHPNMRGHRVFAQVVAKTITGKTTELPELPVHAVPLPRLLAKSGTAGPMRIVAMCPLDTLISSALRRLFPALALQIIPWATAGKSILDLEQDAMRIGWTRYREQPGLPEPDMFVVTIPPGDRGVGREQFYRSWAMILNRAQSFGELRWDCLPILPSVTIPDPGPDQHALEQLALCGVLDKDLPAIVRSKDETGSPLELLTAKLATLLGA